MKRLSLVTTLLLSMNLHAASTSDPHSHNAHVTEHDNRVVLELTPAERTMVLQEMRMFLEGMQKMTGALGRQDMQTAADAARNLGQKMVHEVPPTLRAKLPLEFRQLGSSVHRDFDQIALDAEGMKDVGTTLNQMSATLQKCVNCHSMYQIRTSAHDANH